MSHFTMYLITRVDSLLAVSMIIAIGLSLGGGLFLLFCHMEEVDLSEHKKRIKYIVWLFVVCLTILLSVPTSKEIAAIWLIPKIVNNEDVQKIPNNAAALLNKKLEEWLKDKEK